MSQRIDPGHLPSSRPRLLRHLSDDWAYLLPMFVFLAFTWAGGQWSAFYPASYTAKTLIVAVLLYLLRPAFARIRWSYWWLGLILGVLGVVQWVGMQLWLQKTFAAMPSDYRFFQPPAADRLFNPFEKLPPGWVWAFLTVRIAGAVLLVPLMEELFWRDYLWRRLIAPNDFRLAKVGEWDLKAFVFVPLIFATVHGNWWLTAVVWALLIAVLLVYTRSLGACIVMHATTNLLLAGYVLYTGDWSFW